MGNLVNTGRVTKLLETIRRFAAGDTQARANLDGRDELGSIGAAFDEMAARVSASQRVLAESESRFRLVADSAPVMIWMSGEDRGCNYFNKAWLDFTGRTLEQEHGDGWMQGVHPDDLNACLQVYSQSFEARRPFVREYRLRRSDRGKEIFCVSIATDLGGTTESLPSMFRKVAGYATELVHLQGRALRHHRWVVQLGLAGALAGERLTVVWRARGCNECRRFSTVVARHKLRLVSPRRWPLNPTRLVVRLPETFIQSVRFKRSSYRLWLPTR